MRIHGHRGAEYCRNLIYKAYGVYRSVEATERHANRIKASMTVYQTCPECGRIVRKLNRYSGSCEACNYERLWRGQVEEQEKILKQLQKGGERHAIDTARRKYDAERQKNCRLRKKLCGDYVDLSESLSVPRSEAGKKAADHPEEKEMCAPAYQA